MPLRPLLPLLILSCLAGSVSAQLLDLQPGRNFPSARDDLGKGHSAALALGDIDHDGDLDVVVGNGAEAGDQVNRLYLNAGGLQGGVAGTFLDGTNAHFAQLPSDRTRDIELADLDGDCDLDLVVANDGQPTSLGGISRIHLNQGGLQQGAPGQYADVTQDAWGTLVSVPVPQQLSGLGEGPFLEFSCDCEFGDLDDDGDLDLFHSSYGPALAGDRDSRVFLNDGQARFDELWPWSDPAGTTALPSLDADLVDLDGDFDLDLVLSCKGGQARVFRNDLDLAAGSWPADPFVDITQTALIDTAATSTGGIQYETEVVDVDGDGDFDLWATNYALAADRILRNEGDLTFSMMPDWINFDPLVAESEPGLIDFDGDADLDVMLANLEGTNALHVSGLSQGLTGSDLYSRNGTGLYPHNETPHLAAGTSHATVCADLDEDGDPDVLLANSSDQWNSVWLNTLGVPDTHAPQLLEVTQQGDKADGSDTPVRVQLGDNADPHVIRLSATELLYSVDGGLERRLPMAWQGGQQFRAVIPGGHQGLISYRVRARDRAGNEILGAPHSFQQTSSAALPLQVIGSGTQGALGTPHLELAGTLVGGSPASLHLCDGPHQATLILFASLDSIPLPFKGGLLHTIPILLQVVLQSDPAGQLNLWTTWPLGLPSGTQAWFQVALADPGGPGGAALSNAVLVTTP